MGGSMESIDMQIKWRITYLQLREEEKGTGREDNWVQDLKQ
jgi:hypothetical protein